MRVITSAALTLLVAVATIGCASDSLKPDETAAPKSTVIAIATQDQRQPR